MVTTLYAGQTANAGTVTVANDSAKLYVTFSTTSNWWLTETHLVIAKDLASVPQTKSGNPKIGNFPYASTHNPPVQSYTYQFDKAQLAETLDLPAEIDWTTALTVAAHAVVVRYSEAGNVTDIIQQETAWGDGTRFVSKGSWAMYSKYAWQTCAEPPVASGDFRTQTQGGWGTVCRGGNPGCYRDLRFAQAFPAGLTVGGTHSLTLATSGDVEGFLPQGGTPASLSRNHTNPSTTEAGVLAGQLVAATLSVAFDLADPSFGASSNHLRDLVVVDQASPCNGWTVQAVLDEGNRVLGGDAAAMTPSAINDCLSGINEAFVDGTAVTGFLGY